MSDYKGKIESLMDNLENISREDLRDIQSIMEDGIEPESDEEMFIAMRFDEDRTENGWLEDFSHALSLLAQCQDALNKEIEKRDNDIRELPSYRKAKTFLEVACGSTTHPDWVNLESTLVSYGFDEEIVDLVMRDARAADDPEYPDTF